ncbi:MAG: beta-galactosidase [Syntrophaceae bacterium]
MKFYSKMFTVFFLFAGLLAGTQVNAIEVAKVEIRNGVPKIVIDGKPVQLRFVLGKKTPAPVVFDTTPIEFTGEFICAGDSDHKGTMHFTFVEKPSGLKYGPMTINLDNIAIIDTVTGQTVLGPYDFSNPDEIKKWRINPSSNPAGKLRYSPNSGKDGSPCLQLELKEPKDGIWPKFFLIEHEQSVNLKKGKRYLFKCWGQASRKFSLAINVYLPASSYIHLGHIEGNGDDGFAQEIRFAKEYGNNQIVTLFDLSWPKPDEKNPFVDVDSRMEHILKVNPNALIHLWINIDPPTWWLDKNPDHEQVLLGSRPNIPYNKRTAAVSSKLYRKEACYHLRTLIEHLEKKYGSNIIGYQPCAQNTYEWFYQGIWGNGLPGYALADRIGWNQWLEKKYKTNDALHKTWRTAEYTLGNIDVPSEKLRRRIIKEDLFVDPALGPEYRYVEDFNIFMQEMISDTILEVAKTVKEACNRKKLVFFFYGYYFELGGFMNGASTTGHLNLPAILASPDIDVITAPPSYFDRMKGGCAPQMAPVESIINTGKVWILDDDTRTHLVNEVFRKQYRERVRIETLEELKFIHQRNLGQYLVRNFNNWFDDLDVGWLAEPGIWENVKKFQPLDNDYAQNPISYQPDVAIFVGTQSLRSLANGRFARQILGISRYIYPRLGVPFGQYLLEDYIAGKTNVKVNFLLAAWNLSEKDRAILKKKSEKETIIWGYGAGYLDRHEGSSLKYMEEVLPFKIKKIASEKSMLQITKEGKKFGLVQEYPFDRTPYSVQEDLALTPGKPMSAWLFPSIQTLFTVTDAKPEEILATYSDGSPAIVLRKMKEGGNSIFIGCPLVNRELITEVARLAGAHIYTEQQPVFYSNNQLIVLHGSIHPNDNVKLHFKKKVEIWDYLNKKSLGKASEFTIPLQWSETRILLIDKRL